MMDPGRTVVMLNRDGSIVCRCDNTPIKSSQFEDTVHHDEEGMVAAG